MTPIERLEALLSRVQRNAALLARNRADGVRDAQEAAREVEAVASNGSQRTPIVAAPVEDSFDAREPAVSLEPSGARASVPRSPQSAPRSSEPPSFVVDAGLEAELEGEETSGTWREPARSPEELEPSAPRTPPPESGPQIAPPARHTPEIDELAAISAHSGAAMEQLGATVDLEPATMSPIEVMREPEAPPSIAEDYEEPLIAKHSAVYDETLSPPEGATDELAAMDERERERAARLSAVPEVALTTPDTIAVPPPSHRPEAGPDVLTRGSIPASVNAASYEGGRAASTRTFLALLDDSLGLGAE